MWHNYETVVGLIMELWSAGVRVYHAYVGDYGLYDTPWLGLYPDGSLNLIPRKEIYETVIWLINYPRWFAVMRLVAEQVTKVLEYIRNIGFVYSIWEIIANEFRLTWVMKPYERFGHTVAWKLGAMIYHIAASPNVWPWLVSCFTFSFARQIRFKFFSVRYGVVLEESSRRFFDKATEVRVATSMATHLVSGSLVAQIKLTRGVLGWDRFWYFRGDEQVVLVETGLLKELLSPRFDIPTLSSADQWARIHEVGKIWPMYNVPEFLACEDLQGNTIFVAWEVLCVRRSLRQARMPTPF
jgi:hypothetical protein